MRAHPALILATTLVACAGRPASAARPPSGADLQPYLAAARAKVVDQVDPALRPVVMRIGGGTRRQGGLLVCGSVQVSGRPLAFLTVWRQGETPEQGSALIGLKGGRLPPSIEDLRTFDRTIRLACEDARLQWLLPPAP